MLSPEQKAARANKLTASRIACLMTGDAAAILQLYRELIGEGVEQDLSGVWPVRLGEATETLQLDWYGRKYHVPVERRGEVVVHPKYSWAACTLDGWIDEASYVPRSEARVYAIETKHCGGREPLEVIVDRYQPQLQWIMFCTGTKQIALSVIMGANEPIVEFIDRDEAYIAEMVQRGTQLMTCVTARTPPVELPPVPPPVIPTQHYDFAGNNRWASAAVTWINTKDAAADHIAAEKELKEIVPPDAKRVTGYGVSITRNRIGHLALRELI